MPNIKVEKPKIYCSKDNEDTLIGKILNISFEHSIFNPGIMDFNASGKILTNEYRNIDNVYINGINNKVKKVPMPKKYIINHGATILMWDDGEKTIVKRCADDEFNKRLGFLTAFFQHYSGMSKNKANKFLAELEVEDEEKEEAKETNSENKFRVGDKVKFRKNIKDTYEIDESDIDKMKNKIFEITEISEPRIGKNFYSYYTSIGYFVREDMIEKGDK